MEKRSKLRTVVYLHGGLPGRGVWRYMHENVKSFGFSLLIFFIHNRGVEKFQSGGKANYLASGNRGNFGLRITSTSN